MRAKLTGARPIKINIMMPMPFCPSLLPGAKLTPAQLPGGALANELYLEGGVRSVEIGTLMFADAAQLDLVRLAIPRRTYTQSHMDYLLEVILAVFARRDKIRGLVIEYEAPFLRHFTARLRPL